MGYIVEPNYDPTVNPQNSHAPHQSPPTPWATATSRTPVLTTQAPPGGVVSGRDLEEGVEGRRAADHDPVVTLSNSNTYRSFNNNDTIRSGDDESSAAAKLRKSKKDKKRLVFKNGECNISHCNIQERRRRYLADIFTTMIDIRWRWSFFIFFASFVISWLIFAVIWYIICWLHNDIKNYGRDDWKPCVMEVFSFTSAFLFSIETQHTIGYGSRYTTEECPEAIVIMMIQSALGVMIQAFMVGLIFAKLARPKKRAQTLVFSKNAVICMRNGKYCLLFRVGDVRRSHLVEAHVRVMVIRKKVTREGEILPMYQYDVNVGYDDGCDRIFLVWPITICHEIDEDSPFWDITPDDLYKDDFELVVILEGIVETTGMSTQVRTSYLPSEIYWGRCFERLVHYQEEIFKVDYSRFHCTVPIPDMPRVSPKEWDDVNGSSSSSSSSSSSGGTEKTRSGAVLIDIPDSDFHIDASQNPRHRDVTRPAAPTPGDAPRCDDLGATTLTTTINPLQHLTKNMTPNGHVVGSSIVPLHHKNHPRHQTTQPPLKLDPATSAALATKPGCDRAASPRDVLFAMETGI